jgi:hypothetical protein
LLLLSCLPTAAQSRQFSGSADYIGPQYTFRQDEAKVRPFVYLQAGDQRSSSAGNVEQAFDLQLGCGLQVSLTQRLALQLTPRNTTSPSRSGSDAQLQRKGWRLVDILETIVLLSTLIRKILVWRSLQSTAA